MIRFCFGSSERRTCKVNSLTPAPTATTAAMSDRFPNGITLSASRVRSVPTTTSVPYLSGLTCVVRATITAADVDDYASSIRAYSAIFGPDSPKVAALPTSPEVRIVH